MNNYPQYKNKKVLIFGLGLNDGGLGMAEFFLNQGAIVTITDGKTKEELTKTLDQLKKYGDKVVYHLGGHIKEDFVNNDIIIRNPAIKPDNEWLKIAKENGKEIEMEMSLFHKLASCKIIGITGTRGKSTTTTLVYEILKERYGDKVILGGNIGKSAIRELPNLTEDNIAVLELSSFQLDAMGQSHISSPIAAVTNMYIDHQNWHKDMEDYIGAKKNIFKYQDKEGILVVNIDNDITKNFPSEAHGKCLTTSLINKNADYYLDNTDLTIYENQEPLLNIKGLVLDGEHNLYNILMATAITITQNIDPSIIKKIVTQFKGVAGREELVKEIKGVKYFNDTTATSVEAMKAMFERFESNYRGKIVMIAGGMDKGLDYSLVVDQMKANLKALILLEGTASEKIANLLKEDIKVYKYFGKLDNAIDVASNIASYGDIIILCPGAASFNMFANEFDRGDKFVNYVNQLK